MENQKWIDEIEEYKLMPNDLKKAKVITADVLHEICSSPCDFKLTDQGNASEDMKVFTKVINDKYQVELFIFSPSSDEKNGYFEENIFSIVPRYHQNDDDPWHLDFTLTMTIQNGKIHLLNNFVEEQAEKICNDILELVKKIKK